MKLKLNEASVMEFREKTKKLEQLEKTVMELNQKLALTTAMIEECSTERRKAQTEVMHSIRESGCKSSGRAAIVLKGIGSGYTDEQLEYIADPGITDKEAEAVYQSFSYKRRYPPDRLSKLISMGCELLQIHLILLFYDKRYDRYAELLAGKKYSSQRIRAIQAAWNSRLPVSLVKKADGMGLDDSQILQVLDAQGQYSVSLSPKYRWKCWHSYELPLNSAAKCLSEGRLTPKKIRIFADPSLPAELMCILKLALLAGIPDEKVAEYAKPGMSPRKAHDELMEFIDSQEITGQKNTRNSIRCTLDTK